MYDYVLFDLDGTLTDPGEGMINSIIYSLAKYSITIENRETLYRFIGPPMYENFSCFYGFTPDECRKAVEYYREYYTKNGIYENKLYDGIDSLLKNLKEKGITLILATSKPEQYAKRILEHLNILLYFEYIAGTDMEEMHSCKSDIIQYALSLAGILNERNRVIMVGDREYDVIGANECGIDCIGVLYGYGSRIELERAGAKYIAEDVDALYRILKT